jgi:hypothetical protein
MVFNSQCSVLHDTFHFSFHITNVMFLDISITLFLSKTPSCLYFKTQYKQDRVLAKNMMTDNVQKHNICTNVPLSQTFRSYFHITSFFFVIKPGLFQPACLQANNWCISTNISEFTNLPWFDLQDKTEHGSVSKHIFH